MIAIARVFAVIATLVFVVWVVAGIVSTHRPDWQSRGSLPAVIPASAPSPIPRDGTSWIETNVASFCDRTAP